MICAWKEFVGILPEWMRLDVDRCGRIALQELRLRLGKPPELILGSESIWLNRTVASEDLKFCVNTASRYSPWSAESVSSGYITAPGGHRIGLCGEAVVNNGEVHGIRSLSSLCIRVARDFPGIAATLAEKPGSVLILGSPGSGKTTLLRDLIRHISNKDSGSIAVVDERGELFPTRSGQACFDAGKRTDVLSNCKKTIAIELVLRTMSPQLIAVDEITSEEDCEALSHAAWCGVSLIATAHADSIEDLYKRKAYNKLLRDGTFTHFVVMHHDQSWTLERVTV